MTTKRPSAGRKKPDMGPVRKKSSAGKKAPRRGQVRPTKRRGRRVRIGLILIPLLLVMCVLIGVYAVRRIVSSNATTARVQESTMGNIYTGTLVIARNETLRESESNTTIDFIAAEGSHLRRNDPICRVYSSGYNQTEINRLNSYREQIQNFHENQVFSKYVDAELDSENKEIAELAVQVRTLVRGRGVGSLTNLEKSISSLLSARRSYLKQQYPDDQNLSEMYKVENDQMKKIESWTTTYTAAEDCMVSFYTDGYEKFINANTFGTLTPQDIHQVIRGVLPEQSAVSRGNKPIYRTVLEDEWFALFLCQDRDWNPVVGEQYQVQLEGFEGYTVSGRVDSFTRIGADLLLRMRVTQSVAPVLNIRTCKAAVGDFLAGFYVPIKALYGMENMIGVVVVEEGVQTFVEVTVVSYPDSETAFVRPKLQGSPLKEGKTVRLF